MRRVRVIMEGRVQGVTYRDWAQQTATSLGLEGWVRNRRDGSVEAVFCGGNEAVGRMIENCWNGPPAAEVRAVRIVEEDAEAVSGFSIRPTA